MIILPPCLESSSYKAIKALNGRSFRRQFLCPILPVTNLLTMHARINSLLQALFLVFSFAKRLNSLQWNYGLNFQSANQFSFGFPSHFGTAPSLGNVAPGTLTFRPELPGFPSIFLPDYGKDSCFPSVKNAFDRNFPGLPPGLRKINMVSAQSSPRGIYQLPPSVSPVYGYEEGPIFVPYQLSNSRFPMYVGLDRETYKPVYPQLKALIPYSKLVTTQKPYGRDYVIYLPFQPDRFQNESCGTPIYIPIPGKDGEFYNYQEHSLDVAPYPYNYKRGGQFPNRPSPGSEFSGVASAVGFSMGDAVGAITDRFGKSLPIPLAGIDNALLRQKIIYIYLSLFTSSMLNFITLLN